MGNVGSHDLSAYGFLPAGEWILSATVRSGITYKLTAFASDRVVYSFVIDGAPKYIGICEKDTTCLKDRMGRYKNRQGRKRKRAGGENTNEHVSRRIKDALTAGEKVQIVALKPAAKLTFAEELTIDLIKGLENPLIARFRPEWNRQIS